jgi:hypothetical protein
MLPGGSFLDVSDQDDEAELEARHKRLENRMETELGELMQGVMVDPDAFEQDLLRNVDPALSPFLDSRRPEDLRAERHLERRAGPAIAASLKRSLREAASDEEQSRQKGTIGQLFGPDDRPLGEDW